MKVVYIRLAKGMPTEAEQRSEIFAASGAWPEEMNAAWVERQLQKVASGASRFPQRDYMLGAVRGNDEVWIARPGVIGASEPDILDFLAKMTEQGGVLCVASTGGRHRFEEGVAEALRLVQAIRADERASVMQRARKGIRGRPAGKEKIGRERLEAARQFWFDQTIDSETAAKRSGIGQRTLYRYFGKRETPAFGGRWKPSGKIVDVVPEDVSERTLEAPEKAKRKGKR